MFTHMDSSDCDDTIRGMCYKTDDYKKCIEKTENLGSTAGYFIKKSDNEGICVPLSDKVFHNTNPIYRLRNVKDSEISDVVKSVTVTSFVDSRKHDINPDIANVVFYGDQFELLTDKDMYIKTDIGDNDENASSSPQILVDKYPSDGYLTIESTKQHPVLINRQLKYGDEVFIRIKGTSLRLYRDDTYGNISWLQTTGDLKGRYDYVRIVPISKDDIGKVVCYGDLFRLKYVDEFYIHTDEICNCLSSDPDIQDKGSFMFKFKPAMLGFYCSDSGECKHVKISETDTFKEKSRYMGKVVYRKDYCGVVCQNKNTGFSLVLERQRLNIFLLASVLVFICFILYQSFVRRKFNIHL